MAEQNSLLSVLMKSGSLNDAQMLVEALLSIQTQLSELKDNQRKIMKAIRDLRVEQKNRLCSLNKSMQSIVNTSHETLIDHLNEIQDSVDEQNMEEIDLSELEGLSNMNSIF